MKIKPHFLVFITVVAFSLFSFLYFNLQSYARQPANNEIKLSLVNPDDTLSPPFFSLEAGFYKSSIELVLYHFDPEATIIYTLDGSDPCIESIAGTTYYYKNEYPFYPDMAFGELIEGSYRSEIYEESIILSNRTAQPNKISLKSSTLHVPDYFPVNPVFKGTVVRAKAYKDGCLPSEVVTRSYFVTAEESGRFSLPVISLSIQEDFLYDYEIGIYTAGIDADTWRENNPGEVFSWPFIGNFRRRSDEWEYPAHFEYFEEIGKTRVLSQNVGIRIHGGGSRAFPMKSLRLYARNMYGNSRFDYNFFKNSHHNSFKRLLLRNSGNDFPTSVWEPQIPSRTMFRDAAIQTVFNKLNFDTQAYQPAIVFMNGEYWGIHNIRERYDKNYLERNYNIDEDNIDLLAGKFYVSEGDNLHYLETIGYIEQNELTDETHYSYILTRIDEKNFADYQIANIFARNTDWPGNNIDYWRKRTDSYLPDADYGHDGRWRWLMYDMDFGFGLWGGDEAYLHNTLEFATQPDVVGWPNPDWSTFLLRSFLKNEAFRHYFISRYADLLNTHFLSSRLISVFNDIKSLIEPEIEEHLSRWNNSSSLQKWRSNVDIMIDFAAKRPDVQLEHLREYFNIEGIINVELDVNNQLKGELRVNTVKINSDTPGVNDYPYPWASRYFSNIPIEIEAIPAPGYRFVRWEGDVDSNSEIIEVLSSEDVFAKAIFEPVNEHIMIHYWFFDDETPNNTPLENLSSFYSIMPGADIEYLSCLAGYPYNPDHELWRKASMERRNNPTPLNYRPEFNDSILYVDADMRGLQIKQPFVNEGSENTMIFHLPTIGFSDIVFGFAAVNEGAADNLIIDYSIGRESILWQNDNIEQSVFELNNEYQYYEISFENISEAANNPYLKIRFRFNGDDLTSDDGNRISFNNISLEGLSLEAYIIESRALGQGQILPEGNIPVYEGGNRKFLIIPGERHRLNDLKVDGESYYNNIELLDDGSAVYEFIDVVSNHSIEVFFTLAEEVLNEFDDSLVIFPNPADDYVTVSAIDVLERIDIYNLQGQKVFSYNSVFEKEYSFNTAQYQKGLYIIIITTDKGVYSRKLQIIR